MLYWPVFFRPNKSILQELARKISVTRERIVIIHPVQWREAAEELCRILNSMGKSSRRKEILGCIVPEIEEDERVFFLGEGLFHPLYVSYKIKRDITILGPKDGCLRVLRYEDARKYYEKYEKRLFLSTTYDTYGILLSIKRGQRRDDLVDSVTSILEKIGKKVYKFMCIDIKEEYLVDYSFVDVWVNTACPRVVEDFLNSNIIVVNAEDLLGVLKSYS